MADSPFVIMADLSYRPLEHWAKLWARPDGTPLPITTIKTWIRQGKCPAKKIGGVWMISQLELLNWEPPKEDEEKAVEPPKKEKPKKSGKGEGRGHLRAEEGGRQGSPRARERREEARWPV